MYGNFLEKVSIRPFKNFMEGKEKIVVTTFPFPCRGRPPGRPASIRTIAPDSSWGPSHSLHKIGYTPRRGGPWSSRDNS